MTNTPKLPSPINTPDAGKIRIIVSGPVQIKSGNPKVVVERRD